MSILIAWILAALAVERITEIIHAGDIFENPRHWVMKKSQFFSALIGCGFCLSVWVSATMAWSLPGEISKNGFVDVILKTFALMGLSNILHEGIGRWFKKIPMILCFMRSEPAEVQHAGNNEPENQDHISVEEVPDRTDAKVEVVPADNSR